MAIIDSSVIIHLARVGKLEFLKLFFGKITITLEVRDELLQGTDGLAKIQEALSSWIIAREVKNSEKVISIEKLEQIERADASLLLLAEMEKDMLISNDASLIRAARTRNIECWWLTTFLLHYAAKRIVARNEAKRILFLLVGSGMHLRNDVYAAMLQGFEKA
ncbi:hypothetical protein HYU13_01435 [Candidatus Woesearchaeota archaeon]|nr:hypothetical protein [Candidatus Woesearchaeota archaeon]